LRAVDEPVLRSPACGVSVLIFTLNEAVHLPSCLSSLAWCDDVIVVDSFSADDTEAICRTASVRFVQHAFEGFGAQRNWAIDHCDPKYPWILILDADERVPVEMAKELRDIAERDPPGVGAYRMRRRFHMWGRWLRHSALYPSWVVRFIHKDRVRYINRGHSETQTVTGETLDLHSDLIDENLKGIDEWFARQNRYSRKEAEYELEIDGERASLARLFSRDPLLRRASVKAMSRNLPFRGAMYFLYAFVWRRGFLDGWDGLMFCRMRALYQAEVEIKKYDSKRRQRAEHVRANGVQ
jgi:glycosyltransferase involved in cell wall biosynthesis